MAVFRFVGNICKEKADRRLFYFLRFPPQLKEEALRIRHGSQEEVSRPTSCPECNSELLDEGTLIKCQNLDCPSIVTNSIIYFD